MAVILEDMREFVFPLYLVEGTETTVTVDSREFLGTGFFITMRGDAITASHVIPSNIPAGKRLVAAVQQGGKSVVCWVTHAAIFEASDLALIHVNLEKTRYFEFNDDDVITGTDVRMIGIPKHEVWMSGKEMRLLKGHVTLTAPSRHLELNIPIPSGMSGSPVLVGTRAVAFASKSISSEEIEESYTETKTIEDGKERTEIVRVTRLTHYGLVIPFSRLRGVTAPIFDGLSLRDLITKRNSSG